LSGDGGFVKREEGTRRKERVHTEGAEEEHRGHRDRRQRRKPKKAA
jgi:hypothetical protein